MDVQFCLPHVLYCTVLYCTVLHYNVLYCTVLYCTVTAVSELWLWSTDCFTLFTLQTREKN